MKLFYRLLADFVVTIHFGYVLFLLIGLLLILAGRVFGWSWVRNFWFRAIHLVMILIVVVEAWLGITCPLTTWETNLREKAGEETYEGAFIANWVHETLFFECNSETFTYIYSVFGTLVLLSLILVPPRKPGKVQAELPAGSEAV